ncbi:hypothetical protein MNVM_24100 [Mycobacterium novum]|uniref:Uncharacterized protein n=1 Tax=Mycobacterium novum TaxID=2492438 RepID=A0A7I7JPS1_9MYCO|nr:hypothetical protein [Mycobacterium novum]BBX13329.1 hypothetical protein MNVM_24100 [Mycobacterium novum]
MGKTRIAVGVLGAAVGVAVALAGHAGADAIEDGWPYGTDTFMGAPGYIDGTSWTNKGGEQFGPIGTSYGDYIATHTYQGADDWYTAHQSTFYVPFFYSSEHTEVTGLLDDSAGYPSVGTVIDTTNLFEFDTHVVGLVNLFSNTVINDPDLGYASQFIMWPVFTNTFLITEDGMKDLVGVPGQQFTLFEIPFTDASGGADASDAGDMFAQLLAELAAIET